MRRESVSSARSRLRPRERIPVRWVLNGARATFRALRSAAQRRVKGVVHSLVPDVTVFNDDDRRLLLVALKVLYHNTDRSLAYGYPISRREVEAMVRRLGGRTDLL